MSDFILAFRTSDSDRRTAGITRFVFGLVFFSVLAGREFVIIGFLFVDFNVKLVAEEGKTVTIAVADGIYLRDKLVFTGGSSDIDLRLISISCTSFSRIIYGFLPLKYEKNVEK